MDYKVETISGINYDFIVFSTSYKNPFSQLKDIETTLKCTSMKCKVLFDLLLSNGNGYDRYYEIDFNKDHFDDNTLKIVDLEKGSNQRVLLNKFYNENLENMETDNLGSSIKFLIKKGYLNKI